MGDCDPGIAAKANRLTLRSRVWTRWYFDGTALLDFDGVQTGRLFVSQEERPDGTTNDIGMSLPRNGFIPRKGWYFLFYDSADFGTFKVIKFCDAATVAVSGAFGGCCDDFTGVAHTAPVVAAGPASTVALAANAARIGALLANDSMNAIYVNLGAAAAVNTGIPIEPAGALRTKFKGAINFISSLAGDRLLVTSYT